MSRSDELKKYMERGYSYTKLFSIWGDMIGKCTKRYKPDYPKFGGRGIEVCNSWKDFKTFAVWAVYAGYESEKKLTLERYDEDADFMPDNCFWKEEVKEQKPMPTKTELDLREVALKYDEQYRKKMGFTSAFLKGVREMKNG